MHILNIIFNIISFSNTAQTKHFKILKTKTFLDPPLQTPELSTHWTEGVSPATHLDIMARTVSLCSQSNGHYSFSMASFRFYFERLHRTSSSLEYEIPLCDLTGPVCGFVSGFHSPSAGQSEWATQKQDGRPHVTNLNSLYHCN